MGLGIAYDRWQKKSYQNLPSVILAAGPEQALKDEFLKTIRSNFPADDREVVKLYADEIEPDKLANELRSPGLFTTSKWVVLKQLHGQHGAQTQLKKHWEIIIDFVENPEPDTLLILEDTDHPYKKGRKLGSLAGKIDSNDGWAIIFWEPYENALRDRMRKKLKEAGKSIAPQALQRLLEKTKGKLARADLEVTKLIQLEQEQITVEDVENVVTEEAASDIYQELKDNLVSGQLDLTLRTVSDLLHEGEATFKIFSIIYSYLFRIRQIKRKVRGGTTLKEALEELNIPTTKGIIRQYRRALKKLTDSYPRDFFRNCYQTARKIKYNPPDTSRLALEKFLIKILPGLRSY